MPDDTSTAEASYTHLDVVFIEGGFSSFTDQRQKHLASIKIPFARCTSALHALLYCYTDTQSSQVSKLNNHGIIQIGKDSQDHQVQQLL